MRDHPDKLLITGEDRFLGLLADAGRTCRVNRHGSGIDRRSGSAASCPREWGRHAFYGLATQLDAFGQVTFTDPMDG